MLSALRLAVRPLRPSASGDLFRHVSGVVRLVDPPSFQSVARTGGSPLPFRQLWHLAAPVNRSAGAAALNPPSGFLVLPSRGSLGPWQPVAFTSTKIKRRTKMNKVHFFPHLRLLRHETAHPQSAYPAAQIEEAEKTRTRAIKIEEELIKLKSFLQN